MARLASVAAPAASVGLESLRKGFGVELNAICARFRHPGNSVGIGVHEEADPGPQGLKASHQGLQGSEIVVREGPAVVRGELAVAVGN